MHFSVLLTMKEKTAFLDQISKFHNQAPMEFERVDHFDEQTGGFVMVTDGDQEQFDELPSLQSVRKGTSFSSLPDPVEEPEKFRRKSFSLISMIRIPSSSLSLSLFLAAQQPTPFLFGHP